MSSLPWSSYSVKIDETAKRVQVQYYWYRLLKGFGRCILESYLVLARKQNYHRFICAMWDYKGSGDTQPVLVTPEIQVGR
jgi:hypothetical protein